MADFYYRDTAKMLYRDTKKTVNMFQIVGLPTILFYDGISFNIYGLIRSFITFFIGKSVRLF